MRRWLPVVRSFAVISTRDLLRSPATLVSMGAVFIVFLAIYALLQWSIDAQGGDVDLLRANLGVVLMAGISAVALVGTTVPLVGMRERATLRAFATVPLQRSAFLLGMLPIRAAIVLLELAVVLSVAALRGYLDGAQLLRLVVTAALGAAMLFAVALLLAARARSADAMQQSMAMLSILIVFASGGLLPEEIVPQAVTAAMRALPTTWFAEAAAADLSGSAPFAPVPLLWAGMAVVTAVAAALAVRRFDWDARAGLARRSTREAAHAAR